MQAVAVILAQECNIPYSQFKLSFTLWLERKQTSLWAAGSNNHMTVWTPLCHHLRLRWSDKWDFNWVFRLSNTRRWDRIIQEHINVIKSSQIWQLYCIRKLPALLLLLPLPAMPIPLQGLLLWAALTWLTLIAGSNYRINPNIIKWADMEAKTKALTVLTATYVRVIDVGG